MRWLYYPDIDEEGRRVDRFMTTTDAVRLQQDRAEALGHQYDNDEEALEDFIANNWATWVESWI